MTNPLYGAIILILISSSLSYDDYDPEGSWPALLINDYTPHGKVSLLIDLPIYEVGNGKKTIIYSYDIHGFSSGRTKQICDFFAKRGYNVIMADYFRGATPDNTNLKFNSKQYTWSSIKSDLEEKVFPYLEQKSINEFVMIGSCFGGWVTLEASRVSQKVIGSVTYHPGTSSIKGLNNLGDELHAPLLVLASRHENPIVKKGGLLETQMKKKFSDTDFKTYEDMDHGFVSRGDISIIKVREAVEDALQRSLDFLEKIFEKS